VLATIELSGAVAVGLIGRIFTDIFDAVHMDHDGSSADD